MSDKTPDKVRLVLLVDEEVRDALRLESAMARRDMADIAADLIRTHLAESVEHIRKRNATAAKSKVKSGK